MRWFRKKAPEGFVCRACGKSHEGLPTDLGFALPDEVWAEPEEVRRAHLEWSTDLCFYKERWFLRGVLETPFTFDEGRFGWGIWAEVSQDAIMRFRATFDADGSDLPREAGTIANAIPTYAGTTGVEVEVQFGPADKRPLLYVAATSAHPLGQDQREGISAERYHEILSAVRPEV